MNVDRTGDPGVPRLVAVGDALCHTDPAFAYGLSFSLAHAAGAREAAQTTPIPTISSSATARTSAPEARERYALACETDDARARRWGGEPLDIGHRDGCYPLFSFAAAIAAAPHDDLVLRRTIRRIGLLDRTGLRRRRRAARTHRGDLLGASRQTPPPPPGPPRDELLARIRAVKR